MSSGTTLTWLYALISPFNTLVRLAIGCDYHRSCVSGLVFAIIITRLSKMKMGGKLLAGKVFVQFNSDVVQHDLL